MKKIKYIFMKVKEVSQPILITMSSLLFLLAVFFLAILTTYISNDGFTVLNPFDYCNITDVDYTAILHDDSDGSASVEITEYITFDVHAASENYTYKELWRELPEEYIDGLKVTYDVKSVTQILDNGEEIVYEETPIMYWDDDDFTQDATKRWHHSEGSGKYPDNDESLLIYIPWTYREKMTFKIVYEMNNAVLKYNDCSELYLSMYSGDTIKKLKSYKAQILIPDEIMPSKYYSYALGTSKPIEYTKSNTVNPGYTTFSFNLDKKDLKFDLYSDYIEFCLLTYGEDRHIFTKYAPSNKYTRENVLSECLEEIEYYKKQTEFSYKAKNVVFTASIILSVIAIIKTIRKCKKIKANNEFYKPFTDYEYFRDIPSDLDPIFASELVFLKEPLDENKEKKEEYAAVLLSLVRKKYVTLSKVNEQLDWIPANISINLQPIKTEFVTALSPEENYNLQKPESVIVNELTGEKLEELSTSERLYLDLLRRHTKTSNNSITIDALQRNVNLDFEYSNSFVSDMARRPALENGVIKGYFQSTDYDKYKRDFVKDANLSLVLALFLLICANIVSYITPIGLAHGAYNILGLVYMWKYFYLLIKSNDLILYTQYGVEEQAKWYGLYNFLNSDTLMKEREVFELPLWEKYLIYATAFGISEKVIKAIEIKAPFIDITDSAILSSNSYIHSSSFHKSSRAMGCRLHTAFRGGGAGFYHGYGGGGRGGGGGGGGH